MMVKNICLHLDDLRGTIENVERLNDPRAKVLTDFNWFNHNLQVGRDA